MNKATARQYLSRLNIFNIFLNKELDGLTINDIVNNIKNGSVDPYSILSRYCAYLKDGNNNISTTTIKQRTVTVKNFFEYCDIDINTR